MPRNGSGTFTLVTGNPVSPGTTIESAWANTTLSDIGTELTNSLSRTGAGGMLAAFRLADGTLAAPGVAFLNETGTGFYRAGSGEMWAAVQGIQIQQYTVNGVLIPTGKTFTAQGDSTLANLAYTGTLTGGTGVVNLGSGQFYKDASGNVGIGTASPGGWRLQIDGTAASPGNVSALRLRNTVGGGSSILFDNPLGSLARISGAVTDAGSGSDDGVLTFETSVNGGLVERARITSAGDLLVGDTNGGLQNSYSTNFTKASGYWTVNHANASPDTRRYFYFGYDGSEIGSITQSGTTAVAYNTSSDYRLKDNPQPLTGSGAFIDALQPKTWDWKADGSRGVGFLAHEAQAVSPRSVVGEKDAVDEDGKPIMQAMEYGSAEFIANIIAELQQLRARVAALEA